MAKTRQVTVGALTVEIEEAPGARPTITAWKRYGRDETVLFAGLALETLASVVDAVTGLMAAGVDGEQLAHEREAFGALRQTLTGGVR